MTKPSSGGYASFPNYSPTSPATRILLVRHGQVEWNARAAYTGWTDIDLNDHGIWEAQVIADRLSHVPLTAVYSSDLIRAKRTADMIAERHNLKSIEDPNLREINYGLWEGLDAEEIISQFGQDAFERWKSDPENVEVPGGESFGMLRDRIVPAISKIAERHSGETAVVVAHKSVNRVLICYFLGLPVRRYKEIKQDNTAINSLLFEGNRVVVESVNDVCHIQKCINV